jgi:hypothetical protein
MAKASPVLTAFNAGELSPTLDGRVDLAKYANGCKRIENCLVLVQGPAQRRGGTPFVAEVKDSSKRVWAIKFEFSATQAFLLEFGDQYVRFFTADHEPVTVSGVVAWSNAFAYTVGSLASRLGVNYYCILAHTNQQPPNATYWYPLTGDIYEIPSPYALADISNADGTCALKTEQSGDVIYIANQKRTYAVRKLVRFADTTWRFLSYSPNQGPFLEQNDTTTTLIASASTGSITITASADVFAATDVGRLVRIEVQNLDIKPWETNTAYTANDLARFGGKTYKALNTKTSGTSPPVHEHGTAYDGKDGVQWQYMDSGYGIARITAFTDAQHVTASVIVDEPNGLAQMPANVVSTATKRWALGAWSDTTEYPASVTFWSSRLWFAGKQRYWASVPNDFENMAGDFFGETALDNAIWEQLQAQDVNDILWLAGADKLIIGTGGGEFVGDKITSTDPVGPGNFQALRQAKRRVRAVQPVAVGTSLLYVQRAGRKLLSFNYSIEIDRYSATDLAVLAERITRGGIIDMAFQGEPHSILWCVLSSGKLLSFTYDRDQDVVGWVRHPLGGNGFCEAVAVTPTSDGTAEQVWICVKRTINGVTRRYWEYLHRSWEGPDDDGTPGDDQEDAFYVDCGITYDGTATTSISGLDHLEGETVQVLADGAVQPSKVVTGGAITLDRAASVVHVGLQFDSRLVPMRLEGGSQLGTSQGKTKRIDGLVIRFLDTLGGKMGMYGGRMDDISTRNPATPMGSPPPFFSGDVVCDFPGDYDTDALIEIRQDQPLPMTVVAIMPNLKTYDK